MTGLCTNSKAQTFVKVSRARDNRGEGERWAEEAVHPTLNIFDNGDTRCVCAVVHSLLSSACCPNPKEVPSCQ